jgi:predicted pyridoxine 5'-phosphate oxidase superfamily flavin-nucleotide-binding protein
MSMFHEGNRELQDAFGSRALADRLEQRLSRERFSEEDAAFIASLGFFFLATADAEGRPDCSFKGGPAGFVRVVAPDLLVFPDYDGNGMFKSLGNIGVNPHVGMLFISMGDAPKRLRVNGRAEVVREDPLIDAIPGGPGTPRRPSEPPHRACTRPARRRSAPRARAATRGRRRPSCAVERGVDGS